MKMTVNRVGQLAAACVLFAACTTPLIGQFGNEPQKQLPPPAVNWTQEQDQKNMMDQLGIKALRPGASGNESDPNHSNYDESKANPWPNYPDPLTLKNGEKVTTPEMWWKQRRAEIMEDFDREMYGRVPENVPKVIWTVKVTDHEFVGRVPVIARHLIGRVDNTGYPLIDVNIDMVLVTPANAHGPVPVLMMFGRAALPAPAQPNPDDLEKLNDALRTLLAKSDPSLQAILDKYPAYQPILLNQHCLPCTVDVFQFFGRWLVGSRKPGASEHHQHRHWPLGARRRYQRHMDTNANRRIERVVHLPDDVLGDHRRETDHLVIRCGHSPVDRGHVRRKPPIHIL
jgi:hypothetical protein